MTAPFEPLESASEQILTLKFVLLLALTSLKRVGDLQAFSVSETCMDFAPGLVKVTLRPRPGNIPKVLSTSFRSQVVKLHSFHPPPFASSEDERLHMLCPVRALKLYVDRSKVWRKSPQLLICFGAGRRGLATSKQRISHWVRDAISLAYEVRKLPSPLSLRAHSTRGVASSQALFRGVPLEDICVAAGWSSPHTFVRFYNLDVDTLQVLRSCLFEPTVHCWFISGPDRQRFSAWLVWYIVPDAVNAALSLPMKENVSGYSRNPCSLNRKRDAAYAAKLLTLLTLLTEISEEWMARSPVWADDVIASEMASRHKPMNWRDSIWVQTSVAQWAFPMRSTQRLVPYSENKGYVSNPRHFLIHSRIACNAIQKVLHELAAPSARKICSKTLLHVSCSVSLLSVFLKDMCQCNTFTFTFSHLADAFIQSDLQLGST